MIPQYIYIGLIVLNLLLAANMHGKEKKFKVHNFWTDIISIIIVVSLLSWGGFFDNLFK